MKLISSNYMLSYYTNRKLKSVMDAKSILEGVKIDLESQIRSLTLVCLMILIIDPVNSL